MKGTVLSFLLTGLSSCGNSAALEDLVSAAPELTQGESENQSQSRSQPTQAPSLVNPAAQASAPENQPILQENPQSRERSSKSQEELADTAQQSGQLTPQNTQELLLNFPRTFPVYPQAELLEITADDAQGSGKMLWRTTENRKAVADYYQAELVNKNWDIIKPFTFNDQNKLARAIAVKDSLRVELTISTLSPQNQPEANIEANIGSKVAVVYHPLGQKLPPSSISQTDKSSSEIAAPKNNQPQSNASVNPNLASSKPTSDPAQNSQNNSQNKSNQANNSELAKSTQRPQKPQPVPPQTLPTNQPIASETDFTDLGQVPEQLIDPLEAVAALGILTPYTGKANIKLTKFAPNELITRGEYARWLISANNRYHADNPGKKIYIAAKTSQPAFKDIPANHPDFASIQSLAEAGLIPSRLTEDSTNLLFRPNAPLTREDLVTWKVPLDMRQSLPKASIQAIEESWGFQDATDINSVAIRALYADFQNGDRSNIRRILGYTTLFQPKKPVTRAEAGASLWYFGFQGEGITAGEVLAAETEFPS